MQKPKVILVVGPTASGKTALAIELALALNGEVISADSRQVYRGLDIGSGKVTKEEAKGVPHHLIDITNIENRYSGTDFVRDAKAAIADIVARGKVPIIAGGTFFYTDLLRGKLQAASVPPDFALQAELEKLSTEELLARLAKADPVRAVEIEPKNRRRLVRALEIINTLGYVPKAQPAVSAYDWLIFGIMVDVDTLNARIEKRLHDRLESGMQEEVNSLLKSGIALQRLIDFGLEYRYLALRQNEGLPYDEMIAQLFAKLRQFAKRQRTWLKRDPEIIWKEFPVNTAEVVSEAKVFLNQTTSK